MSNIDRVVAALKTEFEGEVAFSDTIPSNVTPPAVIVAPANPFLENTTHGLILEAWDVLVVVSWKEKEAGLKQMRDLSLRVRKAVTGVGAVWTGASGPATSGEVVQGQIMSINGVRLRYNPNDYKE